VLLVELGDRQGSKVPTAAVMPLQVPECLKSNAAKGEFVGFVGSARSVAFWRWDSVLLCSSKLRPCWMIGCPRSVEQLGIQAAEQEA
jgi:hypothetical protein